MKVNLPRLLFVIYFLFSCFTSLAQKKTKPKVLVYGSSVASFAAAVQCAQSDVAVLWVLEGNELVSALPTPSFSIHQPEHLSGGIWMDVLMRVGIHNQPKDSLAELVIKDVNTQLFKNALDSLTEKQHKLTIVKNASIKQISKAKNGWTVSLPNQKVEVLSVFDGTLDSKLSQFIPDATLMKPIPFKNIEDIDINGIRTLIASGYLDNKIVGVAFSDLYHSQIEGFYHLKGYPQVTGAIHESPFLSNLGQAIGATMAYTAFFKVGLEKVNLRVLQGELLKFRSRIIPYQDVLMEDVNFQNIQKFGLSGIFLGNYREGKYMLDRELEVGVEEVKSPILKYFSRAQLWYREHSETVFDREPFFNLIKIISFKDANTIAARDQQLDKDQKESDLNEKEKTVNRYDFASYFESYCKAFDVSISNEGNILR